MKGIEVKKTFIDKTIEFFSPTWGAKRYRSRCFLVLSGAYVGGSKRRRQTDTFRPGSGDADADILDDLETLRSRSRDHLRNSPIASGAMVTNLVNIVGAGLIMQSRIDRDIVGLKEEEAEIWQRTTEREFSSWANSLDCDISRKNNFYDLQKLVFRSTLESGDVIVLLPFKELKTSHYGLRLQVVEADRLSNDGGKQDEDNLTAGVEKEKDGTPKTYWISNFHPGATKIQEKKWTPIPAFTKSGRRNVIHVYEQLRPGQTRGVPYLSPVIEHLHQLGKYTDAELMAAVVSSLFTVFLKTPGGSSFSPFETDSGEEGEEGQKDYKLGAGAIVELMANEDVSFANPSRPNQNFDQFMQAIFRQIGAALGLPFEVLVQHFTKSYSAARTAMLNAWRVFLTKRSWLVDHFCNLVYEAWLEEAILKGRIIAPGYFDDPLIKQAYKNNIWIGPGQGSIDPQREILAVEKRLELGISTLSEETASLTGTDWDQKVDRIRMEKRIMKEINGERQTTQTRQSETSENELENGDSESDD